MEQWQPPLADRMRPRTLAEFIGQEHILGPGRLLRRAIQADQLSSLIFYGPPGTGKTTLARVIANTTRAHFIAINAVLAGVKEIRAAIESAQDRRRQHQRTLLFVDEVHRFNKAQQDALLPWVENGTVIFIGATTENPYFEVNRALISRSRIFQLKSLDDRDLRQIAAQALRDIDRGYGQRQVQIQPVALQHLVTVANGDARSLLNALELAVETTPAEKTGEIVITLAIAEESIQQRAVLYDKEGDAHFDTISAFIKSLRGSDPDAALYWLAQMVYAGEDPRFIFRRMLILASEDVGLADPQAVVVVNACAQAFDRVGLPEGRYPLAQATLYLATTAKSNSVMGFFDALAAVEQQQQAEVPNPLKDAQRDKKGFGHGAGYLYPHAYRDHWVAQQYLPNHLQGQVFYQASSQGYEATIADRVARRRETQLAALVEESNSIEQMTWSPTDRRSEQWLQRAVSQSGERLAQIRDRLFELASPQRHHLVLDLNAGSGLLTWEALRRVPEGGVYTCAATDEQAQALQAQASQLPELQRPIIGVVIPAEFGGYWQQHWSEIHFDRILGRQVLSSLAPGVSASVLQALRLALTPGGKLVLAESLPAEGQRLYQLMQPHWLGQEVYDRLAIAEEHFYQSTNMDNQRIVDWPLIFADAGLALQLDRLQNTSDRLITPTLLERWFGNPTQPGTYASQLYAFFSKAEVEHIAETFSQHLSQQTVPWQQTILFLQGNSQVHSTDFRQYF